MVEPNGGGAYARQPSEGGLIEGGLLLRDLPKDRQPPLGSSDSEGSTKYSD
jgi:hypothetical protein